MKALIVYHAEHHGNTKKLLDALARQEDVTLMTAAEAASADLAAYGCIGLASGIYYQKFHPDILDFAERMLPAGKKVFFLYTCGSKQGDYTRVIRRVAESKGAQVVGSYGCRGFDTFGPFKLIGGIAKGHPDEKEIAGAAAFYRRLG